MQYAVELYTVDLRLLASCLQGMTTQLKADFAAKVRGLREATGRSQEAFAAFADIDRATYGKLERGELNPSLLTLARLAVALDVTLSGLLDGVSINALEVRAMPRSSRGPRPGGASGR